MYELEMGVGSEMDAGVHSVASQQGEHLGYRWFAGSSTIGHLGPANNGLTSTTVTNAIIDAAHVSEAAMRAAMPTWLRDWYDALDDAPRDQILHELRYHPGVR